MSKNIVQNEEMLSKENSQLEKIKLQITEASAQLYVLQQSIKAEKNRLTKKNILLLQSPSNQLVNNIANQQALINATDDLIWSVDKKFLLITANNAFYEKFKAATNEDIQIGDTVLHEKFGNSIIKIWKNYYTSCFAGKEIITKVVTYNKHSNSFIHSINTIKPIKNVNNKIIALACYSKDITAIKQNIIEVQNTRAELDIIMAHSKDIICAISEDDVILNISNSVYNVLGYLPDECLGKNIMNYVHKDDVERTKNSINEVMDGMNQKQFCNKYLHKNGSTVFLEWSSFWIEKSRIRYSIARNVTEKMNIEFKLKKSEQLFKHLAQNGSDIIVVINSEGKFSYVRPTSFEKLGYKNDELLSGNAYEFIHPDDLPKLQQTLANTKSGNKTSLPIFRIKHKTEGWIWLEALATNLLHDDTINGIVINAINITNKKNIEDALTASNKNYKNLFENNPAAMFIWETETKKIINCNKEALKKYEYNKKEFFNLNLDDIQRNQILPYHKIQKKNTQRLKTLHKTTWEHKKKNGEIIFVDITSHSIEFNNKKCNLTIAIDVTEKIKAVQQLKLNEGLLNEAQRIAKIGSWSFDIDNDIIIRSKQFNEIYGTKNVDGGISYDTYLQLIDKEYRDIVTETGKKARKDGEPFNLVYSIITKKGIKKIIEEFGNAEKNKEGKIIRLFGTSQDITERKHAETKLTETIKRYEIVTKATNDAIWDWDLITNKIYWGNSYYKTFGKIKIDKQSDVDNFKNRMHPDEIKTIFTSLEDAYFGKLNKWEAKHRYLKADKTYAYVTNKAIILKDDNGTATRVIGAMKDITNQIIEEQRLKLMSSVVTNTNDVVIICEAKQLHGKSAKIIFVNDAFTKLTGYTSVEIIGKSPAILQGPKTDKTELKRLSNAIQNWQYCEATLVNYKKNGEEFWNNFSISPVANDEGWYTHWIAVERDVTIQKNTEIQKIFFEKLNIVFSENIDLQATRDRILKEIVQFGDFSVGEIWSFGADKNKIARVSSYAANTKMKKIFETVEQPNIITGEGLTGNAWKTKTIQTWSSSETKSNFIRYKLALQVGLTNAFALPLISANEVVGVLFLANNFNEDSIAKYNNFYIKLSEHLGLELKRKQVETELSKIFNVVPDILALANLNGYFIKINPAACILLEYTEQELLSKPFINFVHPNDIDKTNTVVSNLGKGEPVLYFENRCITKSGKTKYFAWTATVPSLDDEVIYAVAKDITENKNLEAFLQKTTTVAKIGGWEYDLNTNKIHWTNITREIHELPQDYEPILDQVINFYKEGKYRDLLISYINQILIDGKPYDDEFILITKTGREIWVRANGDAEFLNGKCIRLYGSFQDIDERKKAEIELLELNENLQKQAKELAISNEDLEQFAYVASHDLQEPLRMVTSFLTQLNKKYGHVFNEEANEYMHFAVDGAKRMKQLILDLLDFSRAGKATENVETINLNEIINEIKILYRKVIQEKNALILVTKLPNISTHKAAIFQILQNLISNALKYSNKQSTPKISIQCNQTNTYWQFSVQDNGIGIDANYFNKIFIIFQRLHSSAEFDGTGVGLAVTKKIIEALGGKIWVQSTEGKGSTFYFTIPKN